VRTYSRLADLTLTIESYALDGLFLRVSPEFERRTTVIRLEGSGEQGLGEDVTYDGNDQLSLQQAGPRLPLEGRFSLSGFSKHLEGLDLFPGPPSHEASRDYRRWAYESAALDLALRQAGRSLAEALGAVPAPIRFVSSMGLGQPPVVDGLMSWLAHYPDLEMKLDANPLWDDALIETLVSTGAVRVVDFKGAYVGTPVDQRPDAELYARVARAFPDAWLEDPAWTPETAEALAGYRDRVTWDAPIHSIDDIQGLDVPPRMLNFKPSRFGKLESLLDAYDYCGERGIRGYGGGQFELGPGRGQIQYLASLFHPDGSNDVAPTSFHASEPRPGLPRSPLEPGFSPTGFRRENG
jgi:hypothetical protein